MRVFVTGGTGFLGSRFIPRLLREGVEVVCLARSAASAEQLSAAVGPDAAARLTFIRGNLGCIAPWADALRACDVVVHLAAEMRGATAVLFVNNVIATRQLLAAVSPALRRFVLVSSLAVYGAGRLRPGDTLDERCPLDPQPHLRDPYTYSKVAQEEVAWAVHKERGLPLVVVRPGVIYGPGRDCITTRLGLRVGNFLIEMGGRQTLPYTFVDNCADALVRAVLTPNIEGEAFNIVDDDPPTARQLRCHYSTRVRPLRAVTVPGWAVGPLSGLYEWYHRWSGGQLPDVLSRYKSAAMWKPLRYTNEKARERLGWQPRTDFATGLRETFAWLRRGTPAPRSAPADAVPV
jgi:nucleoside-diphosphate-sugar epimerase